MNRTLKPAVIASGFVVLASLLIYLFIYKNQVDAPAENKASNPVEVSKSVSPDFTGNEEAFQNALNLYIQKKKEGVDMTNGPCLGKVADDWVLDIAHNPRQDVDDLEENQCEEFKTGNVKHFIELDPDGNLIRKS